MHIIFSNTRTSLDPECENGWGLGWGGGGVKMGEQGEDCQDCACLTLNNETECGRRKQELALTPTYMDIYLPYKPQ
jgi:hypothetical protein